MFRHTRLALSFVMPDPDRASRPLSSVAPLRRIYAWKTVALRATPPTAPRRAPPSNSRGWLRFSKHIPFSAALLAIGRRPAKGLSLRFLPRQDSGEPFGPVTAGYRAKMAVFLPRQDSRTPLIPVAASSGATGQLRYMSSSTSRALVIQNKPWSWASMRSQIVLKSSVFSSKLSLSTSRIRSLPSW